MRKAKSRREGQGDSRSGNEWCRSEVTKYKCIECNRPIVWLYQVDEYAGKIYKFRNRFRCKKCYYLLGRRDDRVAEGWEDSTIAMFPDEIANIVKPYMEKVLGSKVDDLRGMNGWLVDKMVGSAIRKDLGEEKYRKIFMKWRPDQKKFFQSNSTEEETFGESSDIDYFGEA